MNRYNLDACALIALLQEEPGADKVADVLNSADNDEAEVVMHKVNFLEVYYDAYRSRGKDQANLMWTEFNKLPVSINAEISDEIFSEAGRLKASYKISFADSFALAQAIVFDGELLTADHHEFDVIDGIEPVNFHWIR